MTPNNDPRRPMTALEFRMNEDISKARTRQVLDTEWDVLVMTLGRELELLDDTASPDALYGQYIMIFLPRIAREWNERIAMHALTINSVGQSADAVVCSDSPHVVAVALVRSRYSLDQFIKAVHLYAARPRPTRRPQPL